MSTPEDLLASIFCNILWTSIILHDTDLCNNWNNGHSGCFSPIKKAQRAFLAEDRMEMNAIQVSLFLWLSCDNSIVSMDYALREATSTGFTLTPRQSSRHVATYITDTDFADDLALISDYLEEAQLLLLRLEVAVKTVSLHGNYKKTEYMLYNLPVGDLVTLGGNKLKHRPVTRGGARGAFAPPYRPQRSAF